MTVSVVQLTDTHLVADPDGRLYGVNTYKCLMDAVAKAVAEEPDLVLLTGDVSQDESSESYRHVYHLVSRMGTPIGYLPGNHDRFGVMAAEFNAAGKPIRAERSLAFENWLIVLLDSTIDGRVEGRVAQPELERLEQELAANLDKDAIVCLHHNPFPLPGAFGALGLENPDEVFAVLRRHKKVRAILCGHVHQEFEGERDGIKLFATPSTCFQFKPMSEVFALDDRPAGYRLLRLLPDGAIESAVRRMPALPEGINLSAKTSK